MKKPNTNQPGQRKSSFVAVTASLCDFAPLQRLVERLAFRPTDNNRLEEIQPGWAPFHISSIEVLTGGQLQLANEKETVDITFTSNFMFTCTQCNDNYKLTWVNSLS
ncbi:hypothetical protein [Terrimonas alba]|uniref:hypothetical protein n=1 Tax=Terrimonas alba TaxID=3349636 RepID=UPI0035F3CAB2